MKFILGLVVFGTSLFIETQSAPCPGTCKKIDGVSGFDWKKNIGRWEIAFLPNSVTCGYVNVYKASNDGGYRFNVTIRTGNILRTDLYNMTANPKERSKFQFRLLTQSYPPMNLTVVEAKDEKYIMLWNCANIPPTNPYQTVFGYFLIRKMKNVDKDKYILKYREQSKKLSGCSSPFIEVAKPESCGSASKSASAPAISISFILGFIPSLMSMIIKVLLL